MKVLTVVKKALVFGSLVGMILLAACTDVTDIIGGNFLPEGSNMDLNIMDTVTVETYSILMDSVRTNGTEEHLLGSLNDAVFGKVVSSVYTQFIFGAIYQDYSDPTIIFDSLVLTIAYSGNFYGDTMTKQTLRVFELDEILPYDTGYYSNQTVQIVPTEVASHSFYPRPTTNEISEIDTTFFTTEEGIDSIRIDTTRYPDPQIRINITTSANHSLASTLLGINRDDYIEHDEEQDMDYYDYEGFFEDFKGLYFTFDPIETESSGACVGVNINAVSTGLQIYAHQRIANSTVDIPMNSILAVNSSGCVTFNNHNHFDYQDANNDFKEQVLNGDKEKGKEQVYIQSLAGSRLRVKFPFIKNLNDLGNKIAINKAELVLSAVDDDIEPPMFDVPPQVGIQVQYENDSIYFVPDMVYGADFIGGELDEENNEYRFRITRYIQEVIEGVNEGEEGLYVFVSPEASAYHRVILIGGDPALPTPYSKKARLEITYTIID